MESNSLVGSRKIVVTGALLAAAALWMGSPLGAEPGPVSVSSEIPGLALPEGFDQALAQSAAAGNIPGVDVSKSLTGLSAPVSGAVNNTQGDVSLSNTPNALQQGQLTQVVASSQMTANVTNNTTRIGAADSGYRAVNTLDDAFASHQGPITVSQSAGVASSISQAITFQVGFDLKAPPAAP